MEKDIVIEQLHVQLKQLKARMAAMEDDQAADTAPLQGLLTQLGEFKVRSLCILQGHHSTEAQPALVLIVNPTLSACKPGQASS